MLNPAAMSGRGQSTYTLALSIPKRVVLGARSLDRDDFYAWVWQEFGSRGLLGVDEGTVLSEQAAEQGFETESWTLDAAQAPRERDWIRAQAEVAAHAHAELYFATENEARAAQALLREVLSEGSVGEVREQEPQDWDAEWKRSFLNASEGVFIPPFWRILPAWVRPGQEGAPELRTGERPLLINPGAGFGTGTHETTQLCLGAVGELAAARGPELLAGERVLDFGSGSGILAIGAALLGAQVDAVEIDELAIENARENARLNGVEGRISFGETLDRAAGPYPLVIANILRPVLVQFAPELVKRLGPGGAVILSGLMEKDVAEVDRVYSTLLGSRPRVAERGEWRGLVWASR